MWWYVGCFLVGCLLGAFVMYHAWTLEERDAAEAEAERLRRKLKRMRQENKED